MRERCTNTSTPPSAASWQIPSCSRCLVCGQLGCESCSVKVDPAATRQKLDHLRLNTPYERAKLSRSTGELISEEVRQRQRLVSKRESWLEGLHTTELIERHLVRVVQQEVLYRQQLCTSEQVARNACVHAADQHTVTIALQSSEAAARQATVAREKEQFANLMWRCAHATQVLQLLQRETMTRQALHYNECSQWHRLEEAAVENRRCIAANIMARLHFGDSFAESRKEVYLEWQTEWDSLVASAAAHCRQIGQHMQQRDACLRAAEQKKRDTALEEAATRMRIREEMAEEADYLVECHRTFARQQAALFEFEASQRQGISEKAESGYRVIFLDMKADEDDVREVEARKAERRQSALLFALDQLCAIQYEEHAAFEEILQMQHIDAAGRAVWIEEKAAVRAAALLQCVHEKEAVIAAAEAAARADLQKAMTEGEVDIAQWVESKHHAREELCRAAQYAMEVVAVAERDERFRLLADMATEEALVQQWYEDKCAARVAFAETERTQRCFIAQQEEVCRQAVCSSCVRTAKALEDCLVQQRQQRAKALSAAVDALACVTQEEQDAWMQLRRWEGEEAHHTIAVYHFRCQMQLLHEETQGRALLAESEVAARTEVQTKMSLSARYAAEAALAALRVQLCGVAAMEEVARRCFYEQVGDWYEYVAAEQRAEELRLIRELEERIREELHARQQYMTEDARLYTEEEPLATSKAYGGGDCAVFDFTAGGDSSEKIHGVRKALVLQTLGNPTCAAALSPAAVDFLVSVIDRAGRWRDAAQEALAAAERQARDASKKLVQFERIFAAEKEKKEMYDVSSHREAEERERRVHGEALDKARSQQSIAAEKRRLAEVQAELRDQQKILEALKSSINKQFNR